MKEIVHKFSAGGVVVRNGKVLVITSVSRNSVGFPKGGIDKGEAPERAAVREVKEETGYDVKIIKKLSDYTYEFDWTDGNRHLKTVRYYLMELTNDNPPQPNLQPGEDFETKWITPSEALALLTYDESKDALRLALESMHSK